MAHDQLNNHDGIVGAVLLSSVMNVISYNYKDIITRFIIDNKLGPILKKKKKKSKTKKDE